MTRNCPDQVNTLTDLRLYTASTVNIFRIANLEQGRPIVPPLENPAHGGADVEGTTPDFGKEFACGASL
ncbi:MAG: hypothetical protein OXP09_17830, partial [Gammaproteobacteria bacterium]|nr:hypothetical protein [Gammaproteobacteria bacterium]